MSERYGTFRSSFSRARMSGFRTDADDRCWRSADIHNQRPVLNISTGLERVLQATVICRDAWRYHTVTLSSGGR